jgi:MFS transporter, ACS family, tartrate transporter
MQDLEARTIGKVSRRLIPFLIICYFIAYLDRVNVGFAALTMNNALGLTATMFGFGSGVFFLTYFLLEVPSNLFLDRLGARKWIARIMISWGILSGLMAAIPAIARATGLGNETTFYVIRALLGAAEAGFFPGIIFYLTLWFPSIYRGRITGAFIAAVPLSSVIGAPISGLILGMNGVGDLDGWQWLFIIEAAPAIVLAFVTYFYLTDRPGDAHWLTPDERTWLTERLAAERRQREAAHNLSVWEAMYNPRVWALASSILGWWPAITGWGSGCRRSSRPSGCRMPPLAGSPPFPMRSAPRSWSGTAIVPTAAGSARSIPPFRWRLRPRASPRPR